MRTDRVLFSLISGSNTSRFPGQGGPVLQLARPELNTLSLTVPVLSNGANYNSYRTFGPANNNPLPAPIPPSTSRPSNPSSPPSSDNNYRPIPNTDIRHFRSPENHLTSGQRQNNIQFTQTNNNFKPRPPQAPNPSISAYNLRQYFNQPPSSPHTELQQQQPPALTFSTDRAPLAQPNINLQQQNNVNPLLQSLNQNTQYLNPIFPIRDLGPTSFTNFQNIPDVLANPSGTSTFLSPTTQQQAHSQTHVVPRGPSLPEINYQNHNQPEQQSYSHPLFERPNTAIPVVQYETSSTDNPNPIQQPSFQKHVTTLRTLTVSQNSLRFPHDSYDEPHKHEERETRQHLVPPPSTLQQTEAPQYNQKQQQIQQTWQKLLREQQQQQQQQQQKWSPVLEPTESIPPEYNRHHQAPYTDHSQSHNFEEQSSRQQQSVTESPFRPNTSPYGDSGRFVSAAYKDRVRGFPDLYLDLPSTTDSNFNNHHGNNDYVEPTAPPLTRQQSILPNKKLPENSQRNIKRPQNHTPISQLESSTQDHFATENDGSQPHAVKIQQSTHHSDAISIPHDEYEKVKVQTKYNKGKPNDNDYQDDLYDGRKPVNYDEKPYYDDDDLEKGNPRLEKPEPNTQSDKNEDFRHHNSRIPEVETKPFDGRRQPPYRAGHNNARLRQNQNGQPERQKLVEHTYDVSNNRQRQPQSEEYVQPNQSDSYTTETPDRERPYSSNNDQSETTPHTETTTEERFPHPPPEFYEELNKYKYIENPFASFDFDFDAYLDQLRGNPIPANQQESSEDQEIKNKELPKENYYKSESDNVKSTTYQNLVSSTTTVKPRTQQNTKPVELVNIRPSRPTVNPGQTNEYIKEYQDTKYKTPPEEGYYESESDSVKSTTYQNLVSSTTIGTPRTQQNARPIEPVHIKPSRPRVNHGQTTEYIKEYYPPDRNQNLYNEEIGTHSEEFENHRHTHQDRPTHSDKESVQDGDHTTTTTRTPQRGKDTVNHHINLDPLTVPFYSGDDGNFYANPLPIHPQRPVTNYAAGSKDIEQITDTYYKRPIQEYNSDVIQSTERNTHTTSTSESNTQSHRDLSINSMGNLKNHRPYELSVTTSYPAVRENENSLRPITEVVTTPSRGSKPLHRGPTRNRPQNSAHVYVSQTTMPRTPHDISAKSTYYGGNEYHTQNVTIQPEMHTKEPLATSTWSTPHPLHTTVSSSNRHQNHAAHMQSTEFTPPKPIAEPATTLTESNNKQKKMGYSLIQESVEENDTIKPLRDLKHARRQQSHKSVTAATHTTTLPSTTTREYLSTSSTTQYSNWKTYNTWQDRVPNEQQFELTTPTQTNYKVTENNSVFRLNSELDLTPPTLPEYTTVKLTNIYDTQSSFTPVTYSGVQTSTRPTNELLDSIYDIAKAMFKTQYETSGEKVYFDPSSVSVNQNPVTELILFHPNITTTTASSTTRSKSRRRRPTNKISRPPGLLSQVTKYTPPAADHTTPGTYTIQQRPSKTHSSLNVRRGNRPHATSLPSTAESVIITTTLPSNDLDIRYSPPLKPPSPTSSQATEIPRRLRRPTKTRVDVTSTEAYTDNDQSESFERPLQDSVNRLNKKPLGSIMTTAPQRVEPSVTPATYIQQPAVPASPNVYNNSQRYNPTQYDPYYNIYDEDVEIYRDVGDYSQYTSNQGSRQTNTNTNTNNQQPQYRGQSPYKQPPQAPPQEAQTNPAYAQQSYNTQQDVYVQNIDPQGYNENYNTATDDQVQYNQQSEAHQPNKSPSRVNNAGRPRGDASYTTASGAEQNVNRGTPASVSRSRPTLKPSTAIVSKAQEFVDIYKYPSRRPDPVYPTPQVDKTAAKCRRDVCLLPDCYCGGKDIPGGFAAEEIPQLVLLTFDDSANDLNKGLYSDLFENGRTNPNGCPIAATFYVSHEWTDYSHVQNLYATGHEIASHSISHSFGEQFSQKKWTKEIAGQQEILAAYGGVRLEDVRGMRAPFLAIGGNKMFKMLYDSNFTYDSSMPIYENRPPSWPYTMDYKIFHDCMIPPCPTRSYPGVWEVPMVMWQDLNGGRCSMGDACSNPPTADGVYKMLIKNFERHYTTNRAPFGLFYHAAWFTQPHHKEGFIAFLDTIVEMPEVWLVTNWQAIQWVRDPTPLSRINSFPPFQCNYPERPRKCNNPKVCNLWHKSGVRYMRTCQPCPDVYPWTGKTGVRNSRVDNEIVEES